MSAPPGDALGHAAREVSLAELDRKGIDTVRVLRRGDVDRMIVDAVGRAMDGSAQDRQRLLRESKAALLAHEAHTNEKRETVERAARAVDSLTRANAKLAEDAEGLQRELRDAEATSDELCVRNAGLQRRHKDLTTEHAKHTGRERALLSASAKLDDDQAALHAERDRAELLAREASELREEIEEAKRRARAAAARRAQLEEEMMVDAVGKGLDVGTANLISAIQDDGGNLFVRSQRNAFIEIEQDDYTRNMLTKQGVQYAVLSNRMMVIGDPAFELANILNREMRRPMSQGVLSPRETDALPIMKLLIEKLIGPPSKPGELCFFSVPANPIDFSLNATYHEKLFQDLLGRLGYDARPQNEGHAVVLAELAEDDFTGIGISCGGGMHNVCVAYKALNVISFSTARGGDWIDRHVAQVLGISQARATRIKESGVDLANPKSREEQAVEIYYRDLISYTLKNIKERFENKSDRPDFPDPVDIVFAGGTSMVVGFEKVVRDELKKIEFPIPIRDVRRADDPLHSVAKGCLVAAMSTL